MSRVQADRYIKAAAVHCAQCDRFATTRATREQVRQHVVDTGHTVRYTFENVTVYSPAPEEP